MITFDFKLSQESLGLLAQYMKRWPRTTKDVDLKDWEYLKTNKEGVEIFVDRQRQFLKGCSHNMHGPCMGNLKSGSDKSFRYSICTKCGHMAVDDPQNKVINNNKLVPNVVDWS